MRSPEIVVSITAETDKFVANMARATEAVKAFAEALKSIPWYMRVLFAIQALLQFRRR